MSPFLPFIKTEFFITLRKFEGPTSGCWPRDHGTFKKLNFSGTERERKCKLTTGLFRLFGICLESFSEYGTRLSGKAKQNLCEEVKNKGYCSNWIHHVHAFYTSAEGSCSEKEFIFGQTIVSSLQALCLTRDSSWGQHPSVWVALQD